MRILLCNDDGIFAEGLGALRQELAGCGELYVVAPDRERSGSGHGITVHKPLRVEEVDLDGVPGWAVNGTPADCIKLALEVFLPSVPDLVVSGINRGANLGTDVLYSGTVSAAIEAAIAGIPAMAVSLAGGEGKQFRYAAAFTRQLCRKVLQEGLPPETLLNVNLPDKPPAEQGKVLITRLGKRRYVDTIHRREDPRGRTYYWLAGQVKDFTTSMDYDVGALAAGNISVTPVHFDLTHYSFFQEVASWSISSRLP